MFDIRSLPTYNPLYLQESTNELKQKLSQLAKDKDDLVEQVKLLQASLALAESKQPAANHGTCMYIVRTYVCIAFSVYL